MLNVVIGTYPAAINVCNTSFFHLIGQSYIQLLVFSVCLSFIYSHLPYAQFSFYGLKIELTADLQNKQKRNETKNFTTTLFVCLKETQDLQKV